MCPENITNDNNVQLPMQKGDFEKFHKNPTLFSDKCKTPTPETIINTPEPFKSCKPVNINPPDNSSPRKSMEVSANEQDNKDLLDRNGCPITIQPETSKLCTRSGREVKIPQRINL